MLALAAALALLIPAVPANAAPRPTPVVYARNNGWHDPSRRPAGMFFGNGAAPYIHRLSWAYWGSHGNAYGQGKLHTERVLCQPSAAPGCTVASQRWISVFLRDVRTHGGRRYFAKMTVRFRRHGRWHREHLTFDGAWHGPDKFPWF